MNLTTRLVYLRNHRGLAGLGRQVLAWLFHIDFPTTVRVGRGFSFVHRGVGTIIHPATEIGDDVTLMHQVTLGVADALTPVPRETWPIIHVGDRVVIGAGAKVLAPHTGLTIGAGTTIGANAVLLESTGPDEVWVGVPARRVR
jgi:serine O-acetyltransferase